MFRDPRRSSQRQASYRDSPFTEGTAPGVPGDDALEDLIRTLRDERGFAVATLQNHRRSLRPFLAWLAARGRPLTEAALEDVSAYLASRPRWSRATIAYHVQSLRTLFRHGALRGWCRAGFAEAIDAPRLYIHERAPRSSME